MTDVVDEEAWLLASPQKPRHRGARVVVASVLAVSLLALAAVRGASPSARPAGRLYYEDGQTFAELQTSLEEFEKEWHNAFPEELVAQWEEAAETYAAARKSRHRRDVGSSNGRFTQVRGRLGQALARHVPRRRRVARVCPSGSWHVARELGQGLLSR